MTRTVALCCAHWPAVAATRSADLPLAVVRANRVVAVNEAARIQRVLVGLRLREAQSRCPQLDVVAHDPTRDARAFEAVVGALESVAPRWEVSEPGRCAVPVRGPSRYHGGDRAVTEEVRRVATAAVAALPGAGGDPGAVVGVATADGPRAAAVLAERAVGGARADVVPPGATAERLASLPVASLAAGGPPAGPAAEVRDLVDVLARLGLRTLGQFAALEPTDVLARFGPLGRAAHDLARGVERTTMALGPVAAEIRVSATVDPPAERVDRVAFTAKVLADDLHAELAARGLACTRVLVVAETELGDRIERLWRHEGALSAAAIAQRVRWQLDAWLSTGRTLGRCRGGVSRVELVPDHVVPDSGRQLGFWGGSSEVGERALRAMARVQALAGAESVTLPEWRGGRAPAERYQLVGLDAVDLHNRVVHGDAPWPGSLPRPSPAVVWPSPWSVQVVDAHGRRVGVGGRGLLSAPPARCGLAADTWADVVAWAGPWCVEERWWDPVNHRRRARLQAELTHDGHTVVHLLTLEAGQWWVEATYD